MDETLAALELALRVLAPISQCLQPEPADVEQLRLLDPAWASRPVDELAREVIGQAQNKLAKRRAQQVRSGPSLDAKL